MNQDIAAWQRSLESNNSQARLTLPGSVLRELSNKQLGGIAAPPPVTTKSNTIVKRVVVSATTASVSSHPHNSNTNTTPNILDSTLTHLTTTEEDPLLEPDHILPPLATIDEPHSPSSPPLQETDFIDVLTEPSVEDSHTNKSRNHRQAPTSTVDDDAATTTNDASSRIHSFQVMTPPKIASFWSCCWLGGDAED